MWFLYNLGILLGQFMVFILAPFNTRVKQWKRGREGLLDRIASTVDSSELHTWFHFASLGEFEQGRSVLEAYRENFPKKKIVITFFSPSGYEVRANYEKADYVFYLPADTIKNARQFVNLIHPEEVFVIKYEFWHNYFKELHQRQIPLYLVSAIFRKNQLYFKWYGKPFRSTLRYVSHYFTQNQESIQLLQYIGLNNASLTGDTRFDRVAHLPLQKKEIPAITPFVQQHPVLVAGSTWLPDEERIAELLQNYPDWKLIMAPHIINEDHLQALDAKFTNSVRFSQLDIARYPDQLIHQVLIIDNIGMLSYLYGYADIAYIGGGFGTGIHNTLEAATYGVPVIFGPKYDKFQEAKDLITIGAAFSIQQQQDLIKVFEKLQVPEFRKEAGNQAYQYVQQQAGATGRIMDYLRYKAISNRQ
ncbi:glycosyltransferase N-terminal domain-containing protein [Olivibacter ginsenosidimutans]|uniref:3-deoxy-D-manno-octulosonic acid transferase n=1 Tax=Olivibacter ginsenosidimutans TaxID=1176537 RepID=A0ABP9C458_9SPHI